MVLTEGGPVSQMNCVFTFKLVSYCKVEMLMWSALLYYHIPACYVKQHVLISH